MFESIKGIFSGTAPVIPVLLADTMDGFNLEHRQKGQYEKQVRWMIPILLSDFAAVQLGFDSEHPEETINT